MLSGLEWICLMEMELSIYRMIASIDLHDRSLAYTTQERITCIRGMQEIVIRQ